MERVNEISGSCKKPTLEPDVMWPEIQKSSENLGLLASTAVLEISPDDDPRWKPDAVVD